MKTNATNREFYPNFNAANYKRFEIKGFRDIRAVSGASDAELVIIPVGTENYGRFNLLFGDLLVIKKVQNLSGIKSDALCACDGENGREIIFASEFKGENLLGVVIRVERDLEVMQ